MRKLNAILASNVRRLRELARLNQSELAERAGTTVTTISTIELGKSNTNLALLEAISGALGVSAGQLLEEKSNPTLMEVVEAARVVKEFLDQNLSTEDQLRIFLEAISKKPMPDK